MSDPAALPYSEREKYACEICGNVPDEFGTLDHGRGCYKINEDGGGSEYVEMSAPDDYASVHLRYVGTITGPLIRDDTAPQFPHVEGCGPYSPAMERLERQWQPIIQSYQMPTPREPSPLEVHLERALSALRRGDSHTLTTELHAAHQLFFGPPIGETDQSNSGPPAPIQGQG